VPIGTPREIVARLNTEVVKALRAPDVVERLKSQGAEPVANTPEEFGAFMRAEIEKWGRLVKVAGMKAD
jgi:tripartite-type tricarboxylate transporter receptor subunit TctC